MGSETSRKGWGGGEREGRFSAAVALGLGQTVGPCALQVSGCTEASPHGALRRSQIAGSQHTEQHTHTPARHSARGMSWLSPVDSSHMCAITK